MRSRPDWDTYFLGVAEAVAGRADCIRRRIGAVIVRDHRIVSTGYNGFPTGVRGCLEGACPRGRHYLSPVRLDASTASQCACGHLWPCPSYVEPGSSYDTGPGTCLALHAEVNAIAYGNYKDMSHGIIYVTDEPCMGCLKVIAAAGILRVIWPGKMLDYPFIHK